MNFRPSKKGRGLIINITSLIDVMFLLLIFFMVTSTFKNQPAINLVLPRSATATPSDTGHSSRHLGGRVDGCVLGPVGQPVGRFPLLQQHLKVSLKFFNCIGEKPFRAGLTAVTRSTS